MPHNGIVIHKDLVNLYSSGYSSAAFLASLTASLFVILREELSLISFVIDLIVLACGEVRDLGFLAGALSFVPSER